MKTHDFKQRFSSLASAAVAIWFGGTAVSTIAATNSPVGNWDIYFSGGQKGVALINFNVDHTVDGIEIHAPGKVPKVLDPGIRGVFNNPEDPRGLGGLTNSYNFHYGSATISGNWAYDLKGKLIGVITLTSENSTNGWHFRGTVGAGANPKITLATVHAATSTKSVLRGVPRQALPDISGTYFQAGSATKAFTRTKVAFNQLLTLTPSGFPNIYEVEEHGAGYEGSGFAIVTKNNYLGMYTEHYTPGTTNTEIIALSGKFNPATLTGKISGYDGTNFLSLQIGGTPVVDSSPAR
jgi:hypothetical protein